MGEPIAKFALLLWAISSCLVFSEPGSHAQEAKEMDPKIAATKKVIAAQLGGGDSSFYSLMLTESKVEVDAVNGVIGFGALTLELLLSPVTILEGSRGNRDIRPGMFIENSPQVRPPIQSITIEIVTLQGKDEAVAVILEHLTNGKDPEAQRGWRLVKRTRFVKDAIATSDRVEKHFKQVAAGGQLTLVRRPNPEE